MTKFAYLLSHPSATEAAMMFPQVAMWSLPGPSSGWSDFKTSSQWRPSSQNSYQDWSMGVGRTQRGWSHR